MLRRPPPAALAPYVRCLWYADGTGAVDGALGEAGEAASRRERALPTGATDLVVRLSDAPIHVYESLDDRVGASFGSAVLAGARSRYHVRDTTFPSRAVGVHFRPGGAAALLGIPAHLLAGRHTALADLWGARAAALRDALLDAPTPDAALDRLEAALPGPARPLHPAVVHALARLARGGVAIATVRDETGYSDRRFIELFHRAVGLTPKVYARIRRFQAVLARVATGLPTGWADIALGGGYYDQPHLNREFQAFAGISPGEYRPVGPDRPNHVPIFAARSVPSKRPRRGAG